MRLDSFEQRNTRRMARALETAFRIPRGRELVGVLGNGLEHDNLEALTHWIERRLAAPDARLAEMALPHLADELEQELRRWEAESRWNG